MSLRNWGGTEISVPRETARCSIATLYDGQTTISCDLLEPLSQFVDHGPECSEHQLPLMLSFLTSFQHPLQPLVFFQTSISLYCYHYCLLLMFFCIHMFLFFFKSGIGGNVIILDVNDLLQLLHYNHSKALGKN